MSVRFMAFWLRADTPKDIIDLDTDTEFGIILWLLKDVAVFGIMNMPLMHWHVEIVEVVVSGKLLPKTIVALPVHLNGPY